MRAAASHPDDVFEQAELPAKRLRIDRDVLFAGTIREGVQVTWGGAVIASSGSFMLKARESVAGARIAYDGGRYNNCANRSYYACFQAAIHALLLEGIRLPSGGTEWGHDFVQAQFIGQLINRRHLYASELRSTLPDNYHLRIRADYEVDAVTEVRASRALRRAEVFMQAIVRREEAAG